MKRACLPNANNDKNFAASSIRPNSKNYFRMKKLFILLLVTISPILRVMAQEKLNENLNSIKGKIGEVKIDKTTYNQSLEIIKAETGKLVFASTEVDEKGKSSKDVYEFFLSDIDKNTVIRKPSGKKMFVSATTNNGLKVIKHLKEDKVDGYVSSIEILVPGSDEATALINLITATIPLAKTSDISWNSASEALNWIKDNIGQVSTSSGNISQLFASDAQKNYLVGYTAKKTDSKGVATEENYDFNLLDINKNDIKIKVSGTNLLVTLNTKGNDRYIKYRKNNALQSYTSDLELYATDIEQARNIICAFNTAITKSKAVFPDFKSLKQSLEYISSNISKVDYESKSIGQKIDFTDNKGVKALFASTEADSKGKNIESAYEFYLNDIEDNSVNFKVSGKRISIILNTKNKQKFVRYSKDNNIQNYENEVEILSDNLETTRCIVEAFKYALKNNKAIPETFTSISASIEFLKNNMTDVKAGTDQYKQTFSSDAEPYHSTYTVARTDSKGITTEESLEFYPYLMDANSVTIKASGKYLSITAQNKDKKSFVKRYKNKEQQSYDNEIELMSTDAKQAKDIAEALKYLITNGKPKEKTYSDKQSAINFIISQIGNFKGSGKEVKQKLEMVNNDPCKLTLTITTSDDKGKNTDEIYEFSLSDLNKQMTDYKVGGKNIYVTLITKNKNKLVKAYKNGTQQAFGAEVEIMEDDVDTARNIVEAFKAAITLCEQ